MGNNISRFLMMEKNIEKQAEGYGEKHPLIMFLTVLIGLPLLMVGLLTLLTLISVMFINFIAGLF